MLWADMTCADFLPYLPLHVHGIHETPWHSGGMLRLVHQFSRIPLNICSGFHLFCQMQRKLYRQLLCNSASVMDQPLRSAMLSAQWETHMPVVAWVTFTSDRSLS